MKRVLAVTAFLALLAALAEGFFFAYLHINADNHKQLIAFPLEDQLQSLKADNLRRFVSGNGAWVPDSRLGWKHRPGGVTSFEDWTIHVDTDGSRITPDIGPPRVAVFGDSFAEGSEVDDGDTWAAQLQEMTGVKVAARGVSGYGPDQAAIAAVDFLRSDAAASVEQVIVTVTLENLGRLLTTYRPFYTYPAIDWQFGLKPRFLSAERIWYPPVTDWESLAAVKDGIRAAAGKDDYLPSRILKIDFPYTQSAWPLLTQYGLIVEVPRPWQTDQARATFGHVLDYLAAHGPASVEILIVLLPASRNGWTQPTDLPWMADAVTQRGLSFLDVHKTTAGTTAEDKFEHVHYSVSGNTIVAQTIRAAMTKLRQPRAASQSTAF